MSKHTFAVRGQEVRDVKTVVIVEDERVEVAFENNVFKTDDDKLAEAIDKALADGLGVYCMRVNALEDAEKIVAKHQAAIKGGITASAAQEAALAAQKEIESALQKAKGTDEAGLMVTEDANSDSKPQIKIKI